MRQGQLDAVVRHLRRLAGNPPTPCTDAQLLQQFVAHRDEEAFASLVRRHGGLIRTVCRHILHQEEDVEDALQATLLVLARKAASIRKPNAVASWLYGVAYRTAMNAKKTRARRQQRERQAICRAPAQPVSEVTLRELQLILDAEVQRLPEKYRAPFILCCLEGKSKAEAAQELGWKEGTVSGRLAEARKRLQQRLLRRGVALSAALCATGAFQDTATRAVPTAVVRDVLSYTAGKTGGVSAPAVALAEGVLKAMIATKLKLGVVMFLTLGTMATGMGLFAQHLSSDRPPQAKESENLQLTRAERQQRPEKTRAVASDQFGDALPPRVLARLGTVRLRHGGSRIELVDFSPDGQTLISASQDGVVRLWETGTGREIRHFETRNDHAARIILGSYFALSRDGSFLASAAGSDDLHIWDIATGMERRSLKNPGYPLGRIAISPDGKLLAWGGDRDRVSLWEVATGRQLRSFNDTVVGAVSPLPPALAFSPGSRVLAVGKQEDRTIQLWDTTTGTELRRFRLPPRPMKEGSPAIFEMITDLAFSPNGKVLAVPRRVDTPPGTTEVDLSLWEVTTGRELRHSYLGLCRADRLAFSPDGKMLAFGCTPGPVRVWDSLTLQPLQEFSSGRDFVPCVTFSPDGRTLAVGESSTVRLWDIRTGKESLPDHGHTAWLDSCSLLPDQRHLITAAGDGTVRRWDLATGKELSWAKLPPNAYSIVLAPDGSTAACCHSQPEGDKVFGLWDLATKKERILLRGVDFVAAIFSPNSEVVVTGHYDRKEKACKLLVWDVATGKQQRDLTGYQGGFRDMTFTPDGKMLATAGAPEENAIILRDPATGQELGRIPREEEYRVNFPEFTFSPDSKFLAQYGALRGPELHIHLWNVKTGKKRCQFGPRRNGYWTAAFSPDGRTVAAADQDNRIHLWEVATGSERLVLEGHAGRISKLLFAEHGKTLVSTSFDTTALVWDLTGLRSQGQLHEKKASVPKLPELWNALARSDGAKAYQAIWRFAATPSRTVLFLKEHLHPVKAVADRMLASLVADLDSCVYSVREKATRQPSALEWLAEPALRKALVSSSSLELRQRIEHLLDQMDAIASPEQLRAIRAVEALELAGSVEARSLLEVLAHGAPAARLTQEAKVSLERLAKRSRNDP